MATRAQSAAVEYYLTSGSGEDPGQFMPLISFTTKSSWHAEARHNYDNANTYSFYGGRKFAGGEALHFEVTPMIGAMAGATEGGAAALNVDMGFRRFSFYAQSQYNFSFSENWNKFFFNWSELTYQPLSWCYAGLTVQATGMHRSSQKWEPGCMVGFNFDSFSVPMYLFNIHQSERYFILGFNWQWQKRPNNNL